MLTVTTRGEEFRLGRLFGAGDADAIEAIVRTDRMARVVGALTREQVAALATPESVDRLVTTAHLPDPYLDLVVDRRSAKAPRTAVGRIDVLALARMVADGASIRIVALDRHDPAVGAACSVLADELGEDVTANLYATPGGAQAFDPHYDDHRVIVVQCWGEKTWRVYDGYDGEVPLPIAGMAFDPELHLPGVGFQEFTMRPGDLLHLQPGIMHAARCEGGPSIHITFSTSTLTLGRIIEECVGIMHRADAKLRQGVTLGDLATDDARQRLARRVQEETGLRIAPEIMAEAAERITTEHIGRVTPVLDGAVLTALGGDDAASRPRRWEINPTTARRTVTRGDDVRLLTAAGGLEMGPDEQAFLHAITSQGRFDREEMRRDHPAVDVDEAIELLAEHGVIRPSRG